MSSIGWEIRELENSILAKEEQLYSDISKGDYNSITKNLESIKSDLKYLSILANGSPMNKKDNLKVMEFLRIHLDKLWDLSIPA